MARFALVTISVLFMACLHASRLFAEPSISTWFLPTSLTDENTTVSFELDSTWHVIHGKSSGISGNAWLINEKDPKSVAVELKLPISKLDTGNSSRDEEMRDILFVKNSPLIHFNATQLNGNCPPTEIVEKVPCTDSLTASLEIRSTKLPVQVPIAIERKGEGFIVTGSLPIKWGEYGVKDPSIFIARVDPIVIINFRVLLKRNGTSARSQ